MFSDPSLVFATTAATPCFLIAMAASASNGLNSAFSVRLRRSVPVVWFRDWIRESISAMERNARRAFLLSELWELGLDWLGSRGCLKKRRRSLSCMVGASFNLAPTRSRPELETSPTPTRRKLRVLGLFIGIAISHTMSTVEITIDLLVSGLTVSDVGQILQRLVYYMRTTCELRGTK